MGGDNRMAEKTLTVYLTLSPSENRTGKQCLYISIGRTQDQLSPQVWKDTLFKYTKWCNILKCSW